MKPDAAAGNSLAATKPIKIKRAAKIEAIICLILII